MEVKTIQGRWCLKVYWVGVCSYLATKRREMVGWSDGWLFGRLGCWMVGQLNNWMQGGLAARSGTEFIWSPALSPAFRAEKRNEHAWTFLPGSPGRVWKNGGISNIFLPKNKMFPLITWKEQAICLQKLQAVVITLSLVNFLEEYLIVKRTLTTLISLRCTGNVHV